MTTPFTYPDADSDLRDSPYTQNWLWLERFLKRHFDLSTDALNQIDTDGIVDDAVTSAKIDDSSITTNHCAREQVKWKQYHTFVFTSVAHATYPKLHGTQLTASLAVPNIRAAFITAVRCVNQAGTEYSIGGNYGDTSLAAGCTWTPYIVEDTGTFYLHIVVDGADTYDFANSLAVTGTALIVTVELEAADTL